MALDSKIQVEIPEHGIAYKKVSGKTYVYYVTASYRNEKGQPTCDRSAIGRLDETTGKLIPNRNYYEIYLKQPAPISHGIYHYGVNYVAAANKYGYVLRRRIGIAVWKVIRNNRAWFSYEGTSLLRCG